mmetsp:Transcript_2790/g.9013  ORF Transcript_2790/g.9013 Transcript_2790/m.9013 type:complete len:204 (-) Transcript_2790:5158-5769(-)
MQLSSCCHPFASRLTLRGHARSSRVPSGSLCACSGTTSTSSPFASRGMSRPSPFAPGPNATFFRPSLPRRPRLRSSMNLPRCAVQQGRSCERSSRSTRSTPRWSVPKTRLPHVPASLTFCSFSSRTCVTRRPTLLTRRSWLAARQRTTGSSRLRGSCRRHRSTWSCRGCVTSRGDAVPPSSGSFAKAWHPSPTTAIWQRCARS